MLSPTIFFAVVVGSIFAFQTFGQIDLLTQGGPTTRPTCSPTHLPELRDAEPRQGGGAGHRAVRHHAGAHARAAALPGAAGDLCPLSRRSTHPTPLGAAIRGAARDRRRRRRRVGRYLLLTVLAFIVLFPLYITVVNSLLRRSRSRPVRPTLFPIGPAVGARTRQAWNNGHMGRYLLNSFDRDHRDRVGQLSPRSSPAYAFAFLEFPFKRTLFVVFLATLMVPFEVTIFTNLTRRRRPGAADNTYGGLACRSSPPGSARSCCARRSSACRTTCRMPPRSTATATSASWHVVAVPLARPTVAALGVFAFLSAWNQYLWPLAGDQGRPVRTVQIGSQAAARHQLRPDQRYLCRRRDRGRSRSSSCCSSSRSSSCAASPPAP